MKGSSRRQELKDVAELHRLKRNAKPSDCDLIGIRTDYKKTFTNLAMILIF